MNLNLLWFLPALLTYIVIWVAAILNYKEEHEGIDYDDKEMCFGEGWFWFNAIIVVCGCTITGIIKIIK